MSARAPHSSMPASEPLIAIAHAIRQRERSAVETLELHAQRIAKLNPTLNAMVALDLESAHQRAREADAALARGETWGPLHGVPFALKDCHEVAGFPTTVGAPMFARYRPARDGAVMRQLRAAGAIVFARTNVAEYLADYQCANPVYGRTSNPFDASRTSGGSTGGAAAVATGMTPFDVGTDLAGSVRLPAAFCGVYGLKPTEHRISAAGVHPNPQGHPRQVRALSCVGPLTRSVDDLALLMEVLGKPGVEDVDVPPVPLREPERGAAGLRVAYVPSLDGGPVAASSTQAVKWAAKALVQSGAIVEEVATPLAELADDLRAHGEIVEMMLGAFRDSKKPKPTFEDHLRVSARRDERTAALERWFAHWDVLLCPVAMTNAFKHCETGAQIDVDGKLEPYMRLGSHLAAFNYTGHPALSVPAGFDDQGLPLGVQLVAARWHDGKLLALARALQNLRR
ncbi:MAG TPA: amidase [Burkholderiaceae bacterium]|nr:amidase [Burkholderiaceae bacterium]